MSLVAQLVDERGAALTPPTELLDRLASNWVLLDPRIVEHLRQHGQALSDRLALAAGRVQRRDEFGDVGGRDLVDAARAEQWEDAAELDTMPDRRALRDVDS